MTADSQAPPPSGPMLVCAGTDPAAALFDAHEELCDAARQAAIQTARAASEALAARARRHVAAG
jgi:hypothetical protein